MQRNSTGHTHIFTANGAKLCPDDLAQALNIDEQLAGAVMEDGWKVLRSGGFAYEGGRWYYARGVRQLHNGTESHSGVEPTLLSLDELVKFALDADHFACNKAESCRSGVCRKEGCTLYKYGLLRCRTIRFEMRKQEEAASA